MEKRIPRPQGFMENPYKGKDGMDYHSVEDLQFSNAEHKGLFLRKIRKELGTLVLGTVLTNAALGFGAAVTGNLIWERTRRNIQLSIDADQNRVITPKEWAPVYAELGVTPTQNYGLDLNVGQLRSYLANHPKK